MMMWQKKRDRAPRGGGIWLPLQEFVEPRVEHILIAQQGPKVELGQPEGDESHTSETIEAALLASLTREPISHEEVRRCLEEARRAWKRLSAWLALKQLPIEEDGNLFDRDLDAAACP